MRGYEVTLARSPFSRPSGIRTSVSRFDATETVEAPCVILESQKRFHHSHLALPSVYYQQTSSCVNIHSMYMISIYHTNLIQ